MHVISLVFQPFVLDITAGQRLIDPQMSFTQLPKEIRLQIWTLAYFSEPPRLIALRTKPHDENHDNAVFCPRYSPSPAPTVMNICHEARAEAIYQAQKVSHVVRLPVGSFEDPDPELTEPFYFRFETDILYLSFGGPHSGHHDSHYRNGLVAHLARELNDDNRALRTVAVTDGGRSHSGNRFLYRSLRKFRCLTHIIMVVPTKTREDAVERAVFVRIARRFIGLYKAESQDTPEQAMQRKRVDVDFASLDKLFLRIIPRSEWKDWSEAAATWVEGGTYSTG